MPAAVMNYHVVTVMLADVINSHVVTVMPTVVMNSRVVVSKAVTNSVTESCY